MKNSSWDKPLCLIWVSVASLKVKLKMILPNFKAWLNVSLYYCSKCQFFSYSWVYKQKKKSQVPLCVLNCVRDMFINISSVTSHNSLWGGNYCSHLILEETNCKVPRNIPQIMKLQVGKNKILTLSFWLLKQFVLPLGLSLSIHFKRVCGIMFFI